MVHVLLATAPGHGHLNPLLGLAEMCLEAGHAVTLVVPTSPGFDPLPPTTANPLCAMLKIPMPDIGLDLYDATARFTQAYDNQERIREAVTDYLNTQAGIKDQCVAVYDLHASWLQSIASQFGIPAYVSHVYPTPFALFLVFGRQLLREYTMSRELAPVDGGVTCLPGYGDIPTSDLPWEFYLNKTFSRCTTEQYEDFRFARGIIINDVQEWCSPEAKGLISKHLRNMSLCDWPLEWKVWFLGPSLQPMPIAPTDGSVTTWLNEHEPESVVLVSFGTIYRPTAESLGNLHHTLCKLGSPVLWVDPANDLQGRHSQRLKVVRWIDQRRTLRHPAIKCFVTHGGWNSVLEAFYERGVPLVLAPFTIDQRIIAHFVEARLQVGYRVCETALGTVISQSDWEAGLGHAFRYHKDLRPTLASLNAMLKRAKACHQPREFISLISDFDTALVSKK